MRSKAWYMYPKIWNIRTKIGNRTFMQATTQLLLGEKRKFSKLTAYVKSL